MLSLLHFEKCLAYCSLWTARTPARPELICRSIFFFDVFDEKALNNISMCGLCAMMKDFEERMMDVDILIQLTERERE